MDLPAELQESYLNMRYRNGGGHAVAQVVEALRNKPEGRGFDFH